MIWTQRKPKTHYFEHGWIEFLKREGKLFFHLGMWDELGLRWVKNQPFEVPDEQFLVDKQMGFE